MRTLLTVTMLLASVSVIGGEKLIDIHQLEPTILTDIRYASTDNFTGAIVTGYEAAKCLLTHKAAHALSQVQRAIQSHNLSLLVFDCYRPQSAVDYFVEWTADSEGQGSKAQYYPRIEKEKLIHLGYIASQSGHSRGSTVDLTLVKSMTRQPLDMGSRWDFFDPVSHSASQEVTEQAQSNRRRLKKIMVQHGFRSYYAEWWHFTLENEPFPDTYFDIPVN